MALLKELMESILFFNGRGWYWLLWLAGIVWLWVRKKDSKYRDLLLVLIILAVVLVNPLTGGLLLKLMDDSYQIYSRVFWLLMVEPVVAVFVIDVVDSVHEIRSRRVVAALMVLVLCAGGMWMYDRDTVYYIDNRMEVSGVAIAAAEYVTANRAKEKDKTVLGEGILSQVRQVDGTVRQLYGRRHEDKIEYYLGDGKNELEAKLKRYRKKKVKFLIVEEKKDTTETLAKYGWHKTQTFGTYGVYRPEENK